MAFTREDAKQWLARDKQVEIAARTYDLESQTDAFMRMTAGADCLDSDTPQEAHEKMCITFESLLDESLYAEAMEESNEIFVSRLRYLMRFSREVQS